MPVLLNIVIVLCLVGILLLIVYMITSIIKRHALRQLYADNARDFRFICELLRIFTDKKGIVKNPCLLRRYGEYPPRADAIVVGGGGVLILTAVDAPGQYSTPAVGNWSVWQGGEVRQIPNAFRPGKQYTSVIGAILMKCGISCPVANIVVLTDDHAEVDSLHDKNILTGDRLVPFVQAFNRRRALGRSGQDKLIKAIRQHHEVCLRQLSTEMAGDIRSLEQTGEFEPVVSKRMPIEGVDADEAVPQTPDRSEGGGEVVDILAALFSTEEDGTASADETEPE